MRSRTLTVSSDLETVHSVNYEDCGVQTRKRVELGENDGQETKGAGRAGNRALKVAAPVHSQPVGVSLTRNHGLCEVKEGSFSVISQCGRSFETHDLSREVDRVLMGLDLDLDLERSLFRR